MTQWLFLRFRERGLAYRRNSAVNWCPNDQTVLANEQVVQGRCQRCGAKVTKRELTQWYFGITQYADRLLADMERLKGSWPDRVLLMQKNWIGRSEGAHVDFAVDSRVIRVFTTRPDTLYGATLSGSLMTVSARCGPACGISARIRLRSTQRPASQRWR